MATFGHLAAGLALSRAIPRRSGGRPPSWWDTGVVVVAAAVPDVDFVLPLPHRGMTHSAGFAGAMALGVATAYLPSGARRAVAMGMLAALATSSHAVLDVLTGESGAEAAWPMTDRPVALPSAPLPATPIGSELISRDGVFQAVGELAWSLPLALFGAWPWARRALGR